MEATVLRIGNLVEYNNCICVVSSIHSPKPMKDKRYADKYIIELFLDGLITATIDQIQPILLSEEWLLKFGFQKTVANLRLFRQKGFVLYLDDDDTVDMFKDNAYLCTILYVHQLQTICFALTGKELV